MARAVWLTCPGARLALRVQVRALSEAAVVSEGEVERLLEAQALELNNAILANR